jgi:hypothetical protein
VASRRREGRWVEKKRKPTGTTVRFMSGAPTLDHSHQALNNQKPRQLPSLFKQFLDRNTSTPLPLTAGPFRTAGFDPPEGRQR